MASKHQPWVIRPDDSNRAHYTVQEHSSGQDPITVRLENLASDEPTRQLSCSLSSLEAIAERGQDLRSTLEYRPGLATHSPDDSLELKDCTAKFYACLTPSEEEQIAVIVESKTQADRDGQPARVVSDLDNIQDYAKAGRDYREAMSNGERWRPVIDIVGPGSDRDKAIARVVAQASDQPDRARGDMSILDADIYANRDTKGPDRFFLESPGQYLPVGAEFEISKMPDGPHMSTQDRAINNAIEFAHFQPERESSKYVIGRWALPGDPPRPEERQEVTWGGKQREEMGGKSLDYLVDFNGSSDGRNIQSDAPYVLIRKSDTDPHRGIIEDVCLGKDDAVTSLREAVSQDMARQQNLTPQWSHSLTTPPRPDMPPR